MSLFLCANATLSPVALHNFLQAQYPCEYLSAEAELIPKLVPLWNRLSLP